MIEKLKTIFNDITIINKAYDNTQLYRYAIMVLRHNLPIAIHEFHNSKGFAMVKADIFATYDTDDIDTSLQVYVK